MINYNGLDLISLPSQRRPADEESSPDLARRDDYEEGRSVMSKSAISSINQRKVKTLEARNKKTLDVINDMGRTPPGWMGGINNIHIDRHIHDVESESGVSKQGRRKRTLEGESGKVNKKAVTFSNIESQLRNKAPSFYNGDFTDPGCWGCRNGVLTPSSLESDIAGFQIIADFVFTHLYKVSLDEFYVTIKNIFDEHLKHQVAEVNEQDPPEDWTLEMIKHHFTHCICDPAIDQRTKIQDLQTIYEIAKDNVFQRVYTDDDDEEGKLVIDRENVNIMMHIGSALSNHYLRNTEKSAAFSSGITPITEKKERAAKKPRQL